MFKRDEAARLREEFWTTFGRYMSPVPSADGLKINWVNYRTGLKDVHFRMTAQSNTAIIFIALEQRDAAIRELFFQQFEELKTVLHSTVAEEWSWQQNTQISEGKTISRIYRELPDVSVLNKDHWPDLISFFKPRIIALDEFWQNAQYSFESLK
ncbi:MAG: DUF4268 domain-containing protein [Cyclobacteriaceae bacterium]|nr:DUF4268 domain-containing protein [Cyclobacteriaceae bacterium]